MFTKSGSKNAISTFTLYFYPQDVEAKHNKKGTAMVLLKEGIVNCTITTPGYETIDLTGLRADKDLMHRVTWYC